MGKCSKMGNENSFIFENSRIFMARRSYSTFETKKEAVDEAILMNNIYAEFAENFMGIPVIKGIKSESEKFAGAEETYCIEASYARW